MDDLFGPQQYHDLERSAFSPLAGLYRDAPEAATSSYVSDGGRQPPAPTAIPFRRDVTTGSAAREAMDKALDTLATQLDAGRSEAMTRYLATMSRFRSYSWGNVLLIHVQRPDATHVAGFNTWKNMGRFVKKGEKGILILAPCGQGRSAAAQNEERDDQSNETAPAQEHRGTARRFRPVYVFDVSQTEGKELPEPERVKGNPGEYLERLERLAREEMGITLDYVDYLDGAYGVSMGGMVRVVKHLDEARRFSVLCHEIAHEMLHWAAPEDVRRDKTLVETQAEAVAFTVSYTIGLENATAAAADYIGLYRGNRETLRQSLAAIHQAAGRILEAVTSPPGSSDT